MKYAIILPDGAADEPVQLLGGKTPLEFARKPNMDWIAVNGQVGRVVTVPKGFSPGSDVATLSLFGYDPNVDYTGRAPLEAAAQGIAVGSDQIVFRCNFVTIADGAMVDFTAGHISQTEADQLIDELNRRVGEPNCVFHSGVSYRNLMIASDMKEGVSCVAPHDIPNQPVAQHLPKGDGADRVRQIMDQAHEILVNHEINLVRRDLGENPATHIWLWGQGKPKALEPFAKRFGINGAVIAAVDLIRGIAKCAGMAVIEVPGATGYLDTNYAAKGEHAVQALDQYDLVIVHVEAPDEAGHQGDAREKILALERIDQYVVGPLLEKLRTFDEWRILIAPDHPTPVEKRVHTSDPPPFCMAGTGISVGSGQNFSEGAAAANELLIDPGAALMTKFIKA